MGIMTRLTRLCKADIHGVMDQIENKELMLKQCLREMEESLTKKQGNLNQLKTSLDRLQNDIRQTEQEKEKIEQDLAIAIEREKDDIARLLIKKLLRTDQRLAAAARHAESTEKQIKLLQENIEAQKHQFAEMKLRTESWFQKAEQRQWEACASGIIQDSAYNSVSDEEIELELIKRKDAQKGGLNND